MKATQSSLYREIENLILWFIPVGNNIPKDFALRCLGERMLNEMNDALTACNSYMGFLKYNDSYALKRRLFDSLTYFWKVAYMSGHYNKVTLRKRFMQSTLLVRIENREINKKKDYGIELFRRSPRKNGLERGKKAAQLRCA